MLSVLTKLPQQHYMVDYVASSDQSNVSQTRRLLVRVVSRDGTLPQAM
jgi:hypothetical protein